MTPLNLSGVCACIRQSKLGFANSENHRLQPLQTSVDSLLHFCAPIYWILARTECPTTWADYHDAHGESPMLRVVRTTSLIAALMRAALS